MSALEGLRVNLAVSEPWDFGTVHGTGPFKGELLKMFSTPSYPHSKLAIVKLDEPLRYKDAQYEYIIAQNRHVNEHIEAILNKDFVSCNFSPISPECADSPDPFASCSGEGSGIGLIGALSKA